MYLSKVYVNFRLQLYYTVCYLFINMMCYLPVPPLEGFVMNRVQGDYFESLLYKIFVSIDEQTNVSEVGEII